MNLLKKFSEHWHHLSKFRQDERGSFATITGLSLIALMLCAGIALDYTRVVHTKAIVNDALDAAVLAAGAELSAGTASGAQLKQDFKDFFDANLENRSVTIGDITVSKFDADEVNGRISAEVKAKARTNVITVAGASL